MSENATNTDISTGERVRYARISAALRQSALARESGVSRSSIVRIESGEQEPDEVTLELLARALTRHGMAVTWQELKGEVAA